ncbi:MAG: hypothetical protein E7262_06540 [Lachnospiraceae bacterium]|nr:hypothetical protein [Lachnospiraceae bacterium]
MEHRWVVHGFYFENEHDYMLAKKDEERYLFIMEQIGHNCRNKEVMLEIYNKLNQSDKFKTVVGMSYLKELYGYILRQGIATEEEMLPIEGFTVQKLHSASGYSYAQFDRTKKQMEKTFKLKIGKYKNTMSTMRVTIVVLCVLVVTLFWFGVNKNNASNYASAKEAVIDEYAQWEKELTEREQAIKQKEEELKHLEEIHK